MQSLHLAAELHVDRSIDRPAQFVATNVVGTQVLLDASLSYWKDLSAQRKAAFRFLHVSTDEVYGSLGDDRRLHRSHPYAPRLALFGDPRRHPIIWRGLAPHLRAAGHDHQLLQQLRPVPLPREADPADDPHGLAGQSPCRSTATARTCATGSLSTITRARFGRC